MRERRRTFNVGSCPACGSGRIFVSHTERPIRRLKCRICGHKWKTLEIIDQGPQWLENFLSYMLSEGRLSEYLDVYPQISSIIARSGK